MKILSVCVTPEDESAAWWRISHIAEILTKIGHQVDIIHYCGRRSRESVGPGQSSRRTICVEANPADVHIRHLGMLLGNSYDLVYANTHGAAYCSMSGKLLGIPLVLDMHGGLVEEFILNHEGEKGLKYLRGFLRTKAIDWVATSLCDRIACVSKTMIQYLEHRGLPSKKLEYVANGVDLGFFTSSSCSNTAVLRESLSLQNRFVFGYMGGTTKEQGLDNLVSAAERSDCEGLSLVTVGGSMKRADDRVHLVPRVSRDSLRDYYSLCDVLVLPRPNSSATRIAAPTKFAEYCSMGKPILTTNVGDAADLVREYDCGIVVETNGIEDLVKGMTEFIDMPRTRLMSMGANSRKLAESEFDWNLVAACIGRLVESVA